jgi:hypothetical protein
MQLLGLGGGDGRCAFADGGRVVVVGSSLHRMPVNGINVKQPMCVWGGTHVRCYDGGYSCAVWCGVGNAHALAPRDTGWARTTCACCHTADTLG